MIIKIPNLAEEIKMNQDIEKVWRDEFDQDWFYNLCDEYDTPEKCRISRNSSQYTHALNIYLSACKKRNEEIERLKDEVSKWYREWYNCEVQRAKLEKEIAQLKLENKSAMLANNTLAIANEQLKEELKRERECVDFYADIENWQLRTKDETSVPTGYAVRISNHDAEYVTPANRFFGGKRAREVQSKRKCEV